VPLLDLRRCRRGSSSYGIGCSFRVSHPLKYHRYCFDAPALPLALASAVRFFLSELRPATVRLPAASSLRASPSFRVLPNSTYPTAAAIRSSHGLLLPTALEGSEVHLTRGKPPATFRLQGLVTLLTVYSLESRAGFVSHRQRSWDSPFEGFPFREASAALSAVMNPPTVSPAVFPPPKRQTGPTGPGFWVLTSRKCLATARGFSPTTAGAFHGLSPSRASLRKP
jgi:hypothetical protein